MVQEIRLKLANMQTLSLREVRIDKVALTPTDVSYGACRILAISALFLAVSAIPQGISFVGKLMLIVIPLPSTLGIMSSRTIIPTMLFGIAAVILWAKADWITARIFIGTDDREPSYQRAELLRSINAAAGLLCLGAALPHLAQGMIAYAPSLNAMHFAEVLQASSLNDIISIILTLALSAWLLLSSRVRRPAAVDGESHV